MPGYGVVVEGVKEGKQSPMQAEIHEKKCQKQAVSHTYFLEHLLKTQFFYSNVLNKIYFQDIF